MAGAPIVLRIYGPDNEISQEYVKTFVPWKMLKRSMGLRQVISKNEAELEESDMDAIAGYVLELFEGQGLTLQQIDDGADLADMFNVIKGIISRASGIVNPTLPPAK